MSWYRDLFSNYANSYDEESFTKGTLGEVDFIEREIGFDRSVSILDIGCGTGRHAIELARRGYKTTGVDLSENMLRKAIRRAEALGLDVAFIQRDARELNFREEFDLVLMICEGAFPLMETDEMNFAILEGAARALKKDGKFIFTTLNGLFPLFHSVRDFINSETAGERSQDHSFDLMTFRDYSRYEHIDDDGNASVLACNERYYVPSEISWLLKSLHFTGIEIFGCEIGKWNRDKKLTPDDFEMLVVASFR